MATPIVGWYPKSKPQSGVFCQHCWNNKPRTIFQAWDVERDLPIKDGYVCTECGLVFREEAEDESVAS